MSHEIRTPMNAILGYTEILRHADDIPLKHHSALETILNSGEHLLAIINEVLDLSRIEAGRLELHNQDFELLALIKGISAMFDIRCEQKGLSWKIQWVDEWTDEPLDDQTSEPDKPIWVHGDENKLRQCLINLLSNAVKFTEQGTITLRITDTDSKGDSVSGFTFHVLDSGIGIATEDQSKILEPFQRGKASPATEGTGLGLAITQKQVELMGGELAFESELGIGSHFFFSLPLQLVNKQPEESAESGTRGVVHLAEGYQVDALVVDDVTENRTVLQKLLSGVGVDVRLAENGPQAIEQIRTKIPDVVFMDMRMPGMGGLETSQKVWNEFGKDNLKIVVVSASTLTHQHSKYLSQGFDGFIPKPFRAHQIYGCLAEILHVNYQYVSDPTPTTETFNLLEVSLPNDLLTRLREAAKIRSFTKLKLCFEEVDQLGDEGHQLAEHLRTFVNNYDMNAIVELLSHLREI